MKTGVTVMGVWTSSLFRLLNIGQDIIPHSLPAQVFLYETEKGLAEMVGNKARERARVLRFDGRVQYL